MGEKSKNRDVKLKSYQAKMYIIFIIIAMGITAVLSFVILDRSSKAIRNNTSRLIAANSNQIQMNINSYLEKVEQTAALLFSKETYYKYDSTDESIDEYTKLQREEAILDRIVDLGIMENFSDFGVIYADSHSVGWISNTTKSLYGSEKIYEEIASQITNVKSQDGWFFGVNENFDRLYYVKRLNKNAILVASFYSRDLAKVFSFSDELNGMTIRLIDDSAQILYSSEKQEVGKLMPAQIISLVGKSNDVTISDKEYIINVDSCENGWRVVCTIPTNVILADTTRLRNFTISIAVLILAIFLVVGSVLLIRISNPVNSMVSDLETKASLDGLSGLLNKTSFQTVVAENIEKLSSDTQIAFMIMDVDHFKSINDSEGHAYGDQVIVRTAGLLKKKLPLDSIVGRIGGDEFAFCIMGDGRNLKPYVDEILKNLSLGFLDEFKREHELYNVSVSIGAYVDVNKGESFEALYQMADAALYVSKKAGRNQYTFYEEGMNEHEA